MSALTIRPYLLFFLSTLSSLSIARDTLTHTQPLLDGETLISANGSFALGFFTPATNSKNRYVGIWYNKISIQTVVWVANRRNPIVDSPGSLTITPDGTLIINGNNSNVIWSSAATTISNPIAQILDSGNFVVKEANNDNSEIFAWQSFDHPTDTLLPGMKLGWNLTSGLNRNLTAWAGLTDPSPGTYTEGLDVRGDPQLFLWAGLTPEWRGGPWNGLWFSGIPEMRNASIFSFHFVQTSEEVYYAFHVGDPSTISRLIVNQTGLIQHFIWIDHSKIWSLFWSNPKDQCDHLSPCGPFGVCNVQDSPICHCLQGFDPKSPAKWASGDGSNGCMRRTQLDCRINGTDGFVKLSMAKLPDTTSSTVDMSLSDDDCRAKCLENCSCIAYASANINGTGCIIWTTELTDLRQFEFAGQDIYVRLAAADLGSTSDQSQNILAIVVPIVLGGLLLAWIGCCLWSKKERRRRRAMLGTISFTNPHSYQCTEAKDSELPLFDLGAIIAATNNFSVENKLGEGGFGPVFKGILGDGQEIAVKRLGKTSVQGVDEFRNEIILIAKLQHRNLVRLLGYCIQWGDRMLIYEYMPNGSLDAFLFDKVKCVLLNWQTRYNIIMGIARGLLYLHQDSRFRIIHRDLKASNILLDKEMNPKISDFGTARIFGGDETEVNTRKVVGTYGYMSPEYVMDGKFSVKSDVFSFGVLVLEIISGKKNRGVYITQPHLSLLGHAWSLWKAGNVLELVDESMCHSFPLTEVLRCMKVGLLCVQEWAEDRPTMSSVMLMLSSESAMLPDPKQPGFVAPRGPFESSSSTSNEKSSTVNDISVTIFEGR